MSVLIPLTMGKYAIVDDCDAERVLAHKWQAIPKGNEPQWYAKRRGFYLHVFIMPPPQGLILDHKNHNGLDCRRENLRFATHSQNSMHRRWVPGESGYRGVKRSGKSRWAAQLQNRSGRVNLGTFATPEEAALAYDAGAFERFGEFAILNFPRKIAA